MIENDCTCNESFGQLIFDPDCPTHAQCQWTMRGIPIRCILTADHKGDHK